MEYAHIRRFFVLRRREYLDLDEEIVPTSTFRQRFPVRMCDIAPWRNNERSYWFAGFDETTIHISGSKNYWLNVGGDKSIEKPGRCNPDINL